MIRPHALGKFEDLLVATAKSPAMLVLSRQLAERRPGFDAGARHSRAAHGYGPYGTSATYPAESGRSRTQTESSGLNENYGRELLELHTLSVNGGYSQRDVTEVAQSLQRMDNRKAIRRDGGFRFDPRMHEPGAEDCAWPAHQAQAAKTRAGKCCTSWRTSPQTAHFISLKLAQRFVADDPPAALVDRMAKTF